MTPDTFCSKDKCKASSRTGVWADRSMSASGEEEEQDACAVVPDSIHLPRDDVENTDASDSAQSKMDTRGNSEIGSDCDSVLEMSYPSAKAKASLPNGPISRPFQSVLDGDFKGDVNMQEDVKASSDEMLPGIPSIEVRGTFARGHAQRTSLAMNQARLRRCMTMQKLSEDIIDPPIAEESSDGSSGDEYHRYRRQIHRLWYSSR